MSKLKLRLKLPLLKTNPKALRKLVRALHSVQTPLVLPAELPVFLGDTLRIETLKNFNEVVKKDETPELAYYIIRGFMYVFYFDDKKGMLVTHFFGENSIVAFESLLLQLKSPCIIVSGRETLVATFAHSEILEMYKRWPEMEGFALTVVAEYNKAQHIRQTDLRAMPQLERVESFYFPLRKVLLPVKWARVDDVIANYLGMSVRRLREHRNALRLE